MQPRPRAPSGAGRSGARRSGSRRAARPSPDRSGRRAARGPGRSRASASRARTGPRAARSEPAATSTSGAATCDVAAEEAQERGGGVDVAQRGDVPQAARAVRQERGAEDGERGVLRAADADGAAERPGPPRMRMASMLPVLCLKFRKRPSSPSRRGSGSDGELSSTSLGAGMGKLTRERRSGLSACM